MAVRRTEAQWAEIIEDFKNSGQTMATWCRENGVNAKTMGNRVNAGKVKRKVRTLYEWGKLLKKQEASGQSLSSWCQDNGVKEKTMRTAATKIAKFANTEPETAKQEVGWSETEPHGSLDSELFVYATEASKHVAPASWVGRTDERSGQPTELSTPASWVEVKISEAASMASPTESNNEGSAFSSSPAQTAGSTDITKPTVAGKDTGIRIRLKIFEIETGSEYCAERLMTLARGLLC